MFDLRSIRVCLRVATPPAKALTLATALVLCGAVPAEDSTPVVSIGPDGALRYSADERGNRVPDFSFCGYRGGAEPIPAAAVRVVVDPADGDDGQRVQAAIDHVSSLPADAAGLRGAVLLRPGRFELRGQLRIESSGVVLRGSGVGPNGTVLVATGPDRRTLLRVVGRARDLTTGGFEAEIADTFVPVGADRFQLGSTRGLRVGDQVYVDRPSTSEWIAAIGMDAFGVGWRPGSRDLRWDRTVTSVDERTIAIDAPITMAIEDRYGGGRVRTYTWPGRIENVGVENVRLESEVAPGASSSEDHSWVGITMENVRDAWARQVDFVHFAGGAVCLWESATRITVEDCRSIEPVSEVAGGRRRTFFTRGQLTLFLRCWSEGGHRDFSVGHCAAGPNAFVSSTAKMTRGDSGAVGSWAAGVLFDNVRIDGGGLVLENRWGANQGAGWSAANCMLWQCSATEIRCFRPPTARNWAIGAWADFAGDAHWESRNNFVRPRSLYLAQLEARLGTSASLRQGPLVEYPPGSTNPTLEQAAVMVKASSAPAPTVFELVGAAAGRTPVPIDPGAAPTIDAILESGPSLRHPSPGSPEKALLAIDGGWLTVNGRLKTGRTLRPIWWRGNTRPAEAPRFGPAVTRFVPGRVGTGYTDDLDEVTDHMISDGFAALEHHYGLWYDRRRDDHERVRRRDGDVVPPFYELPFARGGAGIAWDGLSRYDLSRYNPWYWSRLEAFTDLCDRKGLLLVHQAYFQHHLLEAGAHWADFPWRSANNVNDTGFPEPPPYAGDKRIFQAHLFYDATHPVRRPLHRAYIRKCLESFAGRSNVIHLTSAEYTGPLSFVEFWIDTIVEWEEETGRDAIIGLSATKDVQDAILADPRRSRAVSLIDIRYWWYQSSGEAYAPEGGRNLAPRQFARQLRPSRGSFAQVARAVREYRVRFPSKAVLYNAESPFDPWAVLMGGGSLPALQGLDDALLAAIPRMRPRDDIVPGPGRWCLADETVGCLIYTATDGPLSLALTRFKGDFALRWIDPRTGEMTRSGGIAGARRIDVQAPASAPKVLWLSRE